MSSLIVLFESRGRSNEAAFHIPEAPMMLWFLVDCFLFCFVADGPKLAIISQTLDVLRIDEFWSPRFRSGLKPSEVLNIMIQRCSVVVL